MSTDHALWRRLLTVPGVLVAFLLVMVTLPVAIPLVLVADLFTGLRRLRVSRTWLLIVLVLCIEVVGLLALLVLWVVQAGGRLGGTERWRRRHHGLERWYAKALMNAAHLAVGLRLEVRGLSALDPGGVILIGRHTSIADAAIPVVVTAAAGLDVRYVLKKELRWAPCLDIAGHRLPNHFVDRAATDRRSELDAVGRLAEDLDDRTAVVIFPEGTFYSTRRHQRALERLADSNPELVPLAEQLRAVLPPRPGGLLALLERAPDADLVVLSHVGLDHVSSIGRIWSAIPFTEPVSVKLERIERQHIPTDDRRTRWIFELWVEVDTWIVTNRPVLPELPPDRSTP